MFSILNLLLASLEGMHLGFACSVLASDSPSWGGAGLYSLLLPTPHKCLAQSQPPRTPATLAGGQSIDFPLRRISKCRGSLWLLPSPSLGSWGCLRKYHRPLGCSDQNLSMTFDSFLSLWFSPPQFLKIVYWHFLWDLPWKCISVGSSPYPWLPP